MCFKSKYAHIRENVLYLYFFVYYRTDDDIVEAETCKGDIISDKWVFIIDCAICWIKSCIFSLLHGIWIPLNLHIICFSYK
jgi:hypothetical protein